VVLHDGAIPNPERDVKLASAVISDVMRASPSVAIAPSTRFVVHTTMSLLLRIEPVPPTSRI
jgi:hypothetical protein